MRELVTKVNEYFFDIEAGESTDWTSALLFYGVCGLGVFITVVCTVLLIIQ